MESLDVDAVCNVLWKRALSKVRDSVVFCDDSVVESIHWQLGDDAFFKHGALQVRDLSPFETGPKGVARGVFITSQPLLGDAVDTIREILVNTESGFEQIVVITTVPPKLHHYLKFGVFEEESATNPLEVFHQFEEKLLGWLESYGGRNKSSSVPLFAEVLHIPILDVTTLAHHPGFCLFTSKSTQSVASLVDTDLPFINETMISSTASLDFSHLPSHLRNGVKSLVSLIDSLFEQLGVIDQVFSLGDMARVVAKEMANLPTAKNRRKRLELGGSKVSLIFVDRCLDLAAVTTSDSRDVFSEISSRLPSLDCHHVDVGVNLDPLLHHENEVSVLGCLSHPRESSASKLLRQLMKNNEKDGLKAVWSAVSAKLDGYGTDIPNSVDQLVISLKDIITQSSELFKEALKANFHQIEGPKGELGIWQIALAVLEVYQDKERIDKLNAIIAIEKGILQSMPLDADVEGANLILNQLLKVFRKELQNAKKEKRDKKHALEKKLEKVKVEMRWNPNDLIALLVNTYSLCGPDNICHISGSESEVKIKTIFAKYLEELLQIYSLDEQLNNQAEPNKEIESHALRIAIHEAIRSNKGVEQTVESLFQRLSAISKSRRGLKHFRRLYQSGSVSEPFSCRPLLKELVHQLTAKSLSDSWDVDLEHHSTELLKDFLKTGFSYLMGSGASKPRPDMPVKVIFVIGGLSAKEIKTIDEEFVGQQILIWTNKILKSDDILKMTLQPEMEFI